MMRVCWFSTYSGIPLFLSSQIDDFNVVDLIDLQLQAGQSSVGYGT